MGRNPTARCGCCIDGASGRRREGARRDRVSSGGPDILGRVQERSPAVSTAAHAAARNDAPRSNPVGFAPVTLSTGPRPGWATLAALAVAAGLGAVGLGAWALVPAATGSSSAGVTARETALESSVAVLASPRAVRVPLTASARRLVLVVGDRNEAVLLVRGLGRAVDGRAYQAWVKRPGSARQLPAGLFDGADGVVRLTRPVLPGATVSVTVEDADGASLPSRIPRLTATRS